MWDEFYSEWSKPVFCLFSLEHGQTGGCLYLDTLDVAFWNNNINKPDNPYGLDEAYGKLVPTRCQDDLIKYGVLCQTPKNVKFV